MRKRLATLTSNILNPFSICLVLIFLISFESTPGIADALKWSLILIGIGILPVFLATLYLVRKGSLESIFASVRQQRTKIYLLASICAAVVYVILYCFEAPLMLIAAVTTGLSTTVIFTSINLWWKISVHTAFVSALVTFLVILYGWVAIVAVVLVLLMGWARIEQKQHSLTQVSVGTALSALIVVIVFRLFGVT